MIDDPSPARVRDSGIFPARSKMLDVFAADIAMLVADGHIDRAERHALSIPHIAVALADAALQSSAAAYIHWCTTWIQPDFGATAYGQWCTRSGDLSAEVPFVALRVFRLSRQAREMRVLSWSGKSAWDDGSPQAIPCAMLDAQFRWYQQVGRALPIVQTNLARLGVLR